MGVLKSLARKVGAGAARFAKKRIAGALDSASDALERAVFGDGPRRVGGGEEEEEGTRSRSPEVPEDPFAQLKEKQRKESGKVR
ncbi:MAG TPA: hypothetical protein VMI75_10015 [Polyangiaceae bacterium]|nr:hypothetical protein [Polyangiaceae bacterium]